MTKTNHELNCIGLFAGCSGLSLGLEEVAEGQKITDRGKSHLRNESPPSTT